MAAYVKIQERIDDEDQEQEPVEEHGNMQTREEPIAYQEVYVWTDDREIVAVVG